ncbi:MAG: T9SS type A sorting domain-containing protein [Bacteroidia bacterium]|nr:T9SS type A sorting domain-containing protein [Bacteroidia bacterium]
MRKFYLAIFLTATLIIPFTFSGNCQLVINEFDYDQSGTDNAEFVELKNTGVTSIDLSNFTLLLINGTSGTSSIYQTFPLPAVILNSNDYFVICGDSSNTMNCDMDVSPETNLIQNGSPDAIAIIDTFGIVDVVSYEGDVVAPYIEGSGVGIQDYASVDFAGISRYPDGSDTDMNNVDFSFRCISPGSTNLMTDTLCGMTTSLSNYGTDENKLMVFPNPASDILYYHANFSGEVIVSLIDLQGRVVYSRNATQVNGKIEINEFSDGMYTLRVAHENQVLRRRVLVRSN